MEQGYSDSPERDASLKEQKRLRAEYQTLCMCFSGVELTKFLSTPCPTSADDSAAAMMAEASSREGMKIGIKVRGFCRMR